MIPDVTLTCCIEAGRLEHQTLLMIRSLRTFGGGFAQVPVIAVVGRAGPPLKPQTISELDRLGVRVVRAFTDNPAPWFAYANKVAAVSAAQRLATSATIAWIDSDVLFASEPAALDLKDHDFAARSEWLPPAIHRGSTRNTAYWNAVCELFGIEFESIPWVDRNDGRPEQRMFFNSGVFVWRRNTAFAEAYGSAFRKLLQSRLAQANGAFCFADQVILTPVVIDQGLRWHHLSQSDHCMLFQGFLDGPDAAPPMREVTLVHYSKSLDPAFRSLMLKRLRSELPALHGWLLTQLGDTPEASPPNWNSMLLKTWRGIRWRLYGANVRLCPDC